MDALKFEFQFVGRPDPQKFSSPEQNASNYLQESQPSCVPAKPKHSVTLCVLFAGAGLRKAEEQFRAVRALFWFPAVLSQSRSTLCDREKAEEFCSICYVYSVRVPALNKRLDELNAVL